MEEGESPEQFITRLRRYLTRWIELSKTNKTYEGVSELFVREQFINSCPENLSIHLRERAPENVEEVAEQFLIAHEKQLSTPNKPSKGKQHSKKDGEPGNQKENKAEQRIQCFNCKGYGHKAVECRKKTNLIRELSDVFYAIAQVILLRIANLSTIRRVLSKPKLPGIRVSKTQPRKTWD